MLQPGLRHSKPAWVKMRSSPSASACALTAPEPGTTLAGRVRACRLVAVLPEWLPPPADVYVVFQTANQLPAKVRALVDLLVQEFAPYRSQSKTLLGAW